MKNQPVQSFYLYGTMISSITEKGKTGFKVLDLVQACPDCVGDIDALETIRHDTLLSYDGLLAWVDIYMHTDIRKDIQAYIHMVRCHRVKPMSAILVEQKIPFGEGILERHWCFTGEEVWSDAFSLLATLRVTAVAPSNRGISVKVTSVYWNDLECDDVDCLLDIYLSKESDDSGAVVECTRTSVNIPTPSSHINKQLASYFDVHPKIITHVLG